MSLEANLQLHQVILEPNDTRQLATLCGPFDAHLRQIERRMGITIKNRGNDFQLIGNDKVVHAAGELLNHLYREVSSGTNLTADVVHLFLQESGVDALVEQQTD
ncbi:MAG: PhoH family protein, partial [Pseudomonadales bacterium]